MKPAKQFIYIARTLKDNRIQIVDHYDEVDGVIYIENEIGIILKRYKQPIDMTTIHAKMAKLSSAPNPIRQQPSTGKVYLDHLGNSFKSLAKLCSHHGISESKYRGRIHLGWSQEEALTGIRKTAVTDHLGVSYRSKAEMCRIFGVAPATYDARLKVGRTQEYALLGLKAEVTINPDELTVEDHLGNRYKNVSSMCGAYGLRLDLYCQRKKRGWSLAETLTGKRDNFVTDHKGKHYKNIEEMCKSYHVSSNSYRSRIKRGMSQEDALTSGGRERHTVEDHLGNKYSSLQAMCDIYGLQKGTYRVRIKSGWTKEKALTKPTKNPIKTVVIKERDPVYDPKGALFHTHKEMCEVYGANYRNYIERMRRGWTMEEALGLKPRQRCKAEDHHGNQFPSIAAMCRAYDIPKDRFRARRERGWTLQESLEGTPRTNQRRSLAARSPKRQPVFDHLDQEYPSLADMCRAYKIIPSAYRYRIDRGMSKEDALTKEVDIEKHGKPCQDHKGINYNSYADMYRAYGLDKRTFTSRKKSGWPIEKILETKMGLRSPFEYNGITYSSKKEFCRINNIQYDNFIHRIHSGLPMEEAIKSGNLRRRRTYLGEKRVDHLGNDYPSIRAMCQEYNVSPGTFASRIKLDWSLERALTTPLRTSAKQNSHSKKRKLSPQSSQRKTI